MPSGLNSLAIALLAATFCGCIDAEGLGKSRLERLGAAIKRDELRPDRPILAVDYNASPEGRPGTSALMAELPKHPDITQLKLRHNHVTDGDLLVLSKMPRLIDLVVDSENVSDEGLAYVAQASQLQRLGIDSTRITDQGIAAITKLEGLKSLRLNCPRVSDAALKAIATLPELEELKLPGDQITDQGVAQLRSVSRLRFLTLTSEQITDNAIDHIGQLELQELTLLCEQVTDLGVMKLKPSENLTLLNVDSTQVGFQCIPLLQERFPNARIVGIPPYDREEMAIELELSELGVVCGNDNDRPGHPAVEATMTVSAVTDEHLRLLSQLKHLTVVRHTAASEGGNLRDADLERLSGLTRLEQLHIPHSRVTDAGLKVIARLKGLKQLDLTGADITDEAVETLCQLPHLSLLRIGGTQITAAGLGPLRELDTLRDLGIGWSKIRGEDLHPLVSFSRLENLEISPDQARTGLEHLKKLRQLKSITIGDKYHTPNSDIYHELIALEAALPELEIYRDDP